MKDIVLIAPTRDILAAAEKIVETKRYDNIDTVCGSMSEGVRQAVAAVEQGAKVLVTRGGTYRLCCDAVNVPIVEIKVSAYDIIQTLKTATISDDVIGVVGYNNVVDGFDVLKELLPYRLVRIELFSEAQVEDAITQYRSLGIRTFVGDANTTRLASALGCTGIVINSQPESIYTAMREARRILRAIRLQKMRTQRLEAITDFVHDGVVAIDENERVTVLNNAAAEALRVDAAKSIGKHILDIWPNCLLPQTMNARTSDVNVLESIYGLNVVASRIPIIVENNVNGAVETFMSVADLTDMEQDVRRSLSRRGFVAKHRFREIVYRSDVMRRCVENAREFAKYDSPVLITGESGVGKELFAQAIHNESRRRRGPFVEVNCAALPRDLAEAELFGRPDRGGRAKREQGLVELAHGGTIFFNEIHELSPEIQGRLLQVLQQHDLTNSASGRVTPLDVRFICSSDADLPLLVANGEFRRSLYYGLNVLNLALPPLRERREDISELALYYISVFCEKYGKKPMRLPEATAQLLTSGDYAGNVRQLSSLIERCVVLSSFDSVAEELGKTAFAPADSEPEELTDLRTMEQRYIRRVYGSVGGSTSRACAILGIDRSTLWRRLKSSRDGD